MKNCKPIALIAYAIILCLMIAALSLYIANVANDYYNDMNGRAIVMTIGAIAALVAAFAVLWLKPGKISKIASDLLRVVSAALAIAAAVSFIGMRLESFGYVFGSNLELGNQAAFDAASQAVLAIILFVAAWALSVAAAFFEISKSSKP
jgi:hypothetical protein